VLGELVDRAGVGAEEGDGREGAVAGVPALGAVGTETVGQPVQVAGPPGDGLDDLGQVGGLGRVVVGVVVQAG
jgi:hypothetical protein